MKSNFRLSICEEQKWSPCSCVRDTVGRIPRGNARPAIWCRLWSLGGHFKDFGSCWERKKILEEFELIGNRESLDFLPHITLFLKYQLPEVLHPSLPYEWLWILVPAPWTHPPFSLGLFLTARYFSRSASVIDPVETSILSQEGTNRCPYKDHPWHASSRQDLLEYK